MESGFVPGEQDSHESLIERLNLQEGMTREELLSLMEAVRIEDIAEIFPHLRDPLKDLIFESVDDENAAELLSELDELAAIQVLKDLNPDRIAAICSYLPPDEGADLIGYSDEEDQPEILEQMDSDLADQIQTLATYSPDTAGGVMTSEFMSARVHESVRAVLIRIKTSDMEESIQNVYVVNGHRVLAGVVSVTDLLQAKLNQKVREIMENDVISVPLEMDQEEVSRIVNRYDFSAIPVIDGEGRIKGVVTFDDVMDVIEEESSEDMYRMAGEVSMHPTQQHFARRVMARMPWLLVTLGGTYFAALLIQFYEEQFCGQILPGVDNNWTLLLCYIPMIGGMAGNVGIQSCTVMVRGLATGEIYPSMLTRVLMKELLVAGIIGLLSGLIIVTVLFSFGKGEIGTVVALSLFAAIFFAAFLGTMMPFACLYVHVDPAYASGPVLTTMNDLIGYAIYFSIALALL
jgi:magnesium transporter